MWPRIIIQSHLLLTAAQCWLQCFLRQLNKGKTFSDETLKKIRDKALNREPYKYSPTGLKNLRKKAKSLLVFNLNGTLSGEYTSFTEAAINLNCSLKTINRCLKTEKKILKREWILKLK